MIEVRSASLGLVGYIVLDSTTLGPAAGGIRTRAYPSAADGLLDARGLARAMTIKCALAGLEAGGGKGVVLDRPGLDRRAAFEAMGDAVEALQGRFVTAGDAGTQVDDLRVMAERTSYVHTGVPNLAEAVAQGLWACVRAALAFAGDDGDAEGLHVAIQGAGAIGAAVARRARAVRASVSLADLDRRRALAVAARTGAAVVGPDQLLALPCDVLVPAALGGVITVPVAKEIRARAVVPGANNTLASAEAERILRARGVVFVPDPISSAGAVIAGVAESVMGLGRAARGGLIDELGETAREVLEGAEQSGRTASEVAVERASRRIRSAAGMVAARP